MAPDAPEREPEMRRYAALPISKNTVSAFWHSRYFLYLHYGVQLGHHNKNRLPIRKAVCVID